VYFGICEPAKAAKRQIARLASSSVLFGLATTYSLIERELITRKTERRTSKQIEVLPEHARPGKTDRSKFHRESPPSVDQLHIASQTRHHRWHVTDDHFLLFYKDAGFHIKTSKVVV
jgi:hypothetical protein